jgi:hypothetical protein
VLVSRLGVLILLVSCAAPAAGSGTSYYSAAPSEDSSYESSESYESSTSDESATFVDERPARRRRGRHHGHHGQAAQKQCLSEYGTTVCGYGCAAGFGAVKCASQPGGVCGAGYGRVTCFEPTTYVPGVRAECKSDYGTTQCGYGCVAAYGVVRCAQQPGGVCHAAYGSVTCTDAR